MLQANLKLRERKPVHGALYLSCLFVSRRCQIKSGRNELSTFFGGLSGSFSDLYAVQIQSWSDPFAHSQQGGPATDRLNICATASLHQTSQFLQRDLSIEGPPSCVYAKNGVPF